MANLISCVKSQKAWGEEHNGRKLFVVSCYYTNSSSKWSIMGETVNYHLNISLNAKDRDEANEQFEDFQKDKDFHNSVKCYDLSIEELTKGTDYECVAIDIVGSDSLKNVAMRHVASPSTREVVLQNERARVARLFAAKKWKMHEE